MISFRFNLVKSLTRITREPKNFGVHRNFIMIRPDKKITFEPRYDNFMSVFIYVSLIFWIHEFFAPSEISRSLTSYFILLAVLFILYIPIILLQIKYVEIYREKMVIKRVFLKTESVVRFEDIKNITEKNFGFHYGLDYLLIQADGSDFRIFCIYVRNYNKLRQVISACIKNSRCGAGEAKPAICRRIP